MDKKTFNHGCSFSASKSTAKSRKEKRGKSKGGSGKKNTLTEIYDKYYKNQVAALYDAVRGYS